MSLTSIQDDAPPRQCSMGSERSLISMPNIWVFVNLFGEPVVCTPDCRGSCHFCGFGDFRVSNTQPLKAGSLQRGFGLRSSQTLIGILLWIFGWIFSSCFVQGKSPEKIHKERKSLAKFTQPFVPLGFLQKPFLDFNLLRVAVSVVFVVFVIVVQKRKFSPKRKFLAGYPCGHPAKNFGQALQMLENKHFGTDNPRGRP